MNGDELPEGWEERPLRDCVDVLDNLRVPVNSDERARRPGAIPYYGATGQVGWIDDFIFDEELLLLGEDGAPFLEKSKDVAYIVSGKTWVNNHAHVLRPRTGTASTLFLKHYLNSFDYAGHVNGTTRLKLTQASMNSIPVPLPPLAEQKRIVAKVEELLASVNAARDRLARVPAILKRFRQAVLAAAHSGQLTESWRDERRLDAWTTAALGDVPGIDLLTGPFGSALHQSDYVRDGIPFVNPMHLIRGHIEPTRGHTVSASKAQALEKYRLRTGDVVLARRGEMGRTAVVTERENGWLCGTGSFVVRPSRAALLSEFIASWLRSPETVISLEAGSIGSTMINLNQGVLRGLELSIPTIEEQREIIRRVGTFYALADIIEGRVAATSPRADKLIQAILAKAFRGALVPTEAELALAP